MTLLNRLFLVFWALVLIPSLTSAKTFYKWVDQNGSTHYTTTPPPKSAKQQKKVETYGWKASEAVTNQPSHTPNSPVTEQQNPQTPDAHATPPLNNPQAQ